MRLVVIPLFELAVRPAACRASFSFAETPVSNPYIDVHDINVYATRAGGNVPQNLLTVADAE